MLESFREFFSLAGFMPHGYCLVWRPEILWLHAGSDLLIGLSYFMIPLTLFYFIRKLPALPFVKTFALFAAFILLCGATHFVGLWTLWQPVYPLQGLVKFATAVVSLITAFSLIPLLPRALALKTPGQLENEVVSRTEQLNAINRSLADEIEKRKHTEQALRVSEHRLQQQLTENLALTERLRLLTDALPAQIAYVDAEQRYRYVNAGYLCQFARDREQLIGCTVAEVLGDDAYRQAEPHLRAALAGEPQQYDIAVATPCGAKQFDVSYVPDVTPEGEVAGFYALVVDITTHRQTEQALREHQQQLERSNRDLQQFAYIASHDLREPLRAVSSYLKLLEKRHGERLDGEAREFIDIAVDGARRMAELIDGLLDFSRVESGGRKATPVALDKLLDEVSANLRQVISETGAVITRDPLPVVKADPLQCRQLLQNLIANALKFRSAAAPEVHLSARPDNGRWTIAVRDNGIGIKEQFQQRVFQIFQRLHPRDRYPGTGLGLALCQRIVERHGGRIWVESRFGHGATFFFTLPDAGR